MAMFEVRRVRADEWRAIRLIRLEALKDTPIGFSESYEDALAKPDSVWRDRTRRTAESDETAMFVAAAACGRLVGTTGVFAPDAAEREFVVYGVYVTPYFRGPELGTAYRLFDTAISWARTVAGAEIVSLDVHERNDRARAFYRRYGFVETGTTSAYMLDQASSLIAMRYDRPL
jgi:ribosomal protein S18 acetylase RimI-like enzyme